MKEKHGQNHELITFKQGCGAAGAEDFGRSRSQSRSRRNGLLGAGAVKNPAPAPAPAPKRGTIVARKNKTKAK